MKPLPFASLVPLLLLAACSGGDGGENTSGGDGTGGAGDGDGVGTGGEDGTGGGPEDVVYPEVLPGTPSCELIGEVSGGDTRSLDGSGCTGHQNDININGGGWMVQLNVADGFTPIQVGAVPLEKVRYSFTPEGGDLVFFSVSGESCEVAITDSELMGSVIPSLEGSYIITGTGKCDAPLVAESGDLEPVVLSPFGFRALFWPE